MGHRRAVKKPWAMVIAVFALLAVPANAFAQTPAEFFAGKTISLVVGYTAGGNYDLYARLLAESMPRHIPGNPQIVVQNRPGAGGRNTANYVYNVSAKDGTIWALTNNMMPLFQVLDPASARYDLTKAQWIGNMAELNSVVALWHTAPARNLDEAKKSETVLGSTGRGGETYIVPAMMNAVLGTRFKIVTGYPGINEIMLAIERGELNGRSGSWANLTQQHAEWLSSRKIAAIIQIGMRADPEIARPLLLDLARTSDEKGLLELVSGFPVFSRAPWLPAGVPDDRVQALRRAFDATLADPALVAAAKERSIDLKPNRGEEVQKHALALATLPPAVLARAREILQITEKDN
jgi:tripartite-type tricarboxylate transporter receptor subunit TctC